MKKIYLTILFTLAASVGMSWATTNSITINESSHGSVVASSSSAAAGETITLTATSDDGYQLKSISGVYAAQATSSETLNSVNAQTTVTGTKFQCVGTIGANNYGWRVFNNGTADSTLTVSSKDGTTLINKIEFTSTWGGSRKNDMLSVSAGTLSFDGNNPSSKVTINDINATSVTISGSGNNAGKTWCIKSVKVYYTATIENELEISDTQNANVKTFTMVDSEVTISAEFEPAPTPADVYSVAGTMNGWNTAANPMTLVGEELYMAEINLEGKNEFKIVKNNATWYGADKINSLLSDVKMTGDNDISINLPASSLVKFYWDAANEKVYLNLNPATITCTVAGVQALMGEEWSTTAAANDMTNNGDSTFTLVKNGVNLSAGNYAYKVAYNHSWDVSFGNAGENAVLNIGSTGVYDVTFTFNWKTKEVSANAVEQTPFVIENGYYIAGVINGVEGWTVFDLSADRQLIHSNEEYEEWYKGVTLAVGDEFKVVYVENNAISTWYPSGNNNNYVVEADHAGDKTVYFRPDGQGGSGWHEGVIYVQPNPIQLNLVAGWNTVCLPYAAEIANVDAYEIQDYNFGGGTISLTPSNDTLTAAKSYLINAAAAGAHTATLMGGKVTTPVEVDGFLGNLSETPVVLYATDEDYGYFVLSNNEFHLLTGTATANVAQYKAYIRLGKASAPSVLSIVNGATNIQNVEGNETAVKFIENGKLFIKKNGVVYDEVGVVVK